MKCKDIESKIDDNYNRCHWCHYSSLKMICFWLYPQSGAISHKNTSVQRVSTVYIVQCTAYRPPAPLMDVFQISVGSLDGVNLLPEEQIIESGITNGEWTFPQRYNSPKIVFIHKRRGRNVAKQFVLLSTVNVLQWSERNILPPLVLQLAGDTPSGGVQSF